MNRRLDPSLPTALFAACLAACAASPGSPPPSAVESSVTSTAPAPLVPAPKGMLDWSAQAGSDVSLAEVLRRLADATGIIFSTSDGVRERLEHTTVSLGENKRIDAAQAYPWAESLLEQNGFMLGVMHGGQTPLIGVYSNAVRGAKPPSVNIEADQIEVCRAHPAFMFSTIVTLPNSETRSLGNVMRTRMKPTDSGAVIPAGTTHSLILVGSGRMVSDMVGVLAELDAEAAKKSSSTKDP